MKMPKFELSFKALLMWATYLSVQAVRYSVAVLAIAIIGPLKLVFGGANDLNTSDAEFVDQCCDNEAYEEIFAQSEVEEQEAILRGDTKNHEYGLDSGNKHPHVGLTCNPYLKYEEDYYL